MTALNWREHERLENAIARAGAELATVQTLARDAQGITPDLRDEMAEAAARWTDLARQVRHEHQALVVAVRGWPK